MIRIAFGFIGLGSLASYLLAGHYWAWLWAGFGALALAIFIHYIDHVLDRE